MNYHSKMKIFLPHLRGRVHKSQLCITHRIFMHSSSKVRCEIISYHNEIKIFAPHFQGKVYKNQLCIAYRRFMHFSSGEGCIQINYSLLIKGLYSSPPKKGT